MVSFRFPCKIGSVDVQMKKFVSKMQGKREDESENNFVSNRCKSVIIVDSLFLGMSFCYQRSSRFLLHNQLCFVASRLNSKTESFC